MLDRDTMTKAEERLENLALWDAIQRPQPNIPVLKEAVADALRQDGNPRGGRGFGSER